MSMGWDCVSELRPPTGLLLIPQVIWTWKAMVEWRRQGKLLILTPELSGNPTSSHLVTQQEKLTERNDESGLMKYLCSYFLGIFNMLCNLTTWGWRLYFPSEAKRVAEVTALKNPSLSAGNGPVNLASNGKHTSHYTTEDDLVAQLVKKCRTFYWTWKFITVFTTVHHWSLSWATWIQ
jgi:hypothetical protein